MNAPDPKQLTTKFIKTLARPDELLIKGIRTLVGLPGITGLNLSFYSTAKSSAKAGGDIAFIGKKKLEKARAQLFSFDEHEVHFQEHLKEFQSYDSLDQNKVYWLNLHGIHDVKLIEKVGHALQLDRLTLQQIVDTTQRPKVDDFEHYLFFSIKSIEREEDDHLNVEQMSFVLGNRFVASFQEEPGDHFGHIRSKIKEGVGPIRKRDSDYLLFQLLDAVLDNYFETIDVINQGVAALETQTLTNPTQETLLLIEKAKKSAELIKKSLSPFKEALTNILKDRTHFLRKSNRKYFRDLRNSCSNAIEGIDGTLKSLESLTNIYFSSLSQKMNETMKVLTLVATIFIPLTFIAGIYGMNFDNMPELRYKYGYFAVWGVMLLIMIGMLVYFRRKKWL